MNEDLSNVEDIWASRLTRVLRKSAYQGDASAAVRQRKPHECGRCKERFRNPAALTLHVKERH